MLMHFLCHCTLCADAMTLSAYRLPLLSVVELELRRKQSTRHRSPTCKLEALPSTIFLGHYYCGWNPSSIFASFIGSGGSSLRALLPLKLHAFQPPPVVPFQQRSKVENKSISTLLSDFPRKQSFCVALLNL
jgi:hypothetical protein